MSEPTSPRAIVLMGVSSSGKTTTGRMLSKLLGWPFRDADSFHPPANIAKMSRGIPLEDADRWPWLDAIAAFIEQELAAQRSVLVTTNLPHEELEEQIGARTVSRLSQICDEVPLFGADRRYGKVA